MTLIEKFRFVITHQYIIGHFAVYRSQNGWLSQTHSISCMLICKYWHTMPISREEHLFAFGKDLASADSILKRQWYIINEFLILIHFHFFHDLPLTLCHRTAFKTHFHISCPNHNLLEVEQVLWYLLSKQFSKGLLVFSMFSHMYALYFSMYFTVHFHFLLCSSNVGGYNGILFFRGKHVRILGFGEIWHINIFD